MHRSVPGQQQQQAPYSRDLGSGPRRFGGGGGGGGGARRWLTRGAGSTRRLHPILLIPVFLCGAFLAPWLGLASTSTESRLPEPVYHPPERDWTPQKVLAPADAPPLRRDDDEYAAAYAAPPPPPPPKRAQARDWQTYDGDGDGDGDDGDDSFLVHAGLLYFRTSPALIPEHRLERPIPIAPLRPRNIYQQAPSIPDSAAGAAGWTEPPPAPRDWLVPGELFAHPPGRRKHLTPPSDPNPNLAAAKPKPVVIPRQRAPAVPPARQPPPPPQPQRDEHNGHVLGPNAAAMARAKREGRPFVPGTPAELLEKVKAHRQRIQDEIEAERRKAEEPLLRQRQQELLLRQEAEADRRRKQQQRQQQQAAMRPGLGLRKIDTDGKAPPPPPHVGEANLLWGDDDEQDDDQHGSSAVEDDLALLAAIRALTPAELRDLSPDERQLVAELEQASQQQQRDLNGQERERGGGRARGAAAGAVDGAGAGAQRRGGWNARALAQENAVVPPAAAAAAQRRKKKEEGKHAGGGGGGGERQKQMAALRGGRLPQRREKRALLEEEADGEQQQQGAAAAVVVVVDDDPAKTAAVEGQERGKASVANLDTEPNKVDYNDEHQDQDQEQEQGRLSLTRRASIPIAASSETSDRLHPITHLIAEAEQEWENMLRRQSQSLEQAVREYKKRYKMNPPAGFDSWWRYAMQNRIVLVDEYDQIYDDILPFLSLPPSEFRRRVTHLKTDASLPWRDSSFSFSIRDGHVQTPGAGESTGGKDDLLDIIGEIASMLPDLEIRMNRGDEPAVAVSGEAKKRHNDLAERHKLLPPAALYDVAEPTGFSPWDSLCPSNSTARRVTQGLPVDMPAKSPFLRSFVATQQHSVANDLCEHPEIRDLNGFTSWAGPRPHLLYPLFSPMKTSVHSDLLFPSITNDYYTEIGRDPLWEQKKYNQVLWRGETTGAYHAKGTGWRQTQRARLVQLANEQTGQIKLHLADASASDSLRLLHAPSKDVLPLYFDVAYSGAPIQCSSKDTTCQQLQRDYRFDRALLADQENQYKYVLDVDANYASGKFKRLMSSRSLVFKSSIFMEWWSKRIMPWYHYIPIQSDYSDLIDVAAYFIGAPDGSGSHDKVAKRIAQQGKKWSDEHWREVDMKAYLFRLLLEYARLLNRDAKDVHSMDFL